MKWWRESWATVALALLCAGSAWHAFSRGPAIVGDGQGNYMWLRAFIVHGDWILHESDRVPTTAYGADLQRVYLHWAEFSGGRIISGWPMGSAMLWLLPVGVTHAALLLLHRLGIAGLAPADGYSAPYHYAVCAGTVCAGLVGISLCFSLVRRFRGPVLAAGSVAAILYGTALNENIFIETASSEGGHFAVLTAILWIWYGLRHGRAETRSWIWAVWGGLIGLAFAMRIQNGVLFLLPAVEMWRRRSDRRIVRLSAACIAGILVPTAAQLIVARLATGSWHPIINAVEVESWIRWWPQLVLFSARHGLFASHPLWWLGLLGFGATIRKDRWWLGGLAAIFMVYLYVNQLPVDFHGGPSLGARRFVPLSLLPAIGVGWTWVWLTRFNRRYPYVAVTLIFAFLVHLAVEYQTWFIRRYDRREFAVPQPLVAGDVLARYYRQAGWPFSWPENLLWALRHRTSPDLYDEGSARFMDLPDEHIGPRWPAFAVAAARPLVIDWTYPASAHLLNRSWRPTPEGAELIRPSGRIWVNFVRLRVDRVARLEVEVSPGRDPVKIVVRVGAQQVLESVAAPGRRELTWPSPAGQWTRGTNSLVIEAPAAVGRLRVVRLTLDPAASGNPVPPR